MEAKKPSRWAFDPDYAVSPGSILSEKLAARGLTPRVLARRTGMSLWAVKKILDGSALLTPGMAEALAGATGVSATMWTNLERMYREQLARTKGQ